MRRATIKKNIAENVLNNEAVGQMLNWFLKRFEDDLSEDEKQAVRDAHTHNQRVTAFLSHIKSNF